MPELALGVTVFRRVDKLEQLLNSIAPEPIDKVYVADQGETTERKQKLYGRSYPFELEVFDLDFNVGTGYCRWIVAEESTEDYLLIADSDNTIPDNVGLLVNQLEDRPVMGGISGILAEDGRIWCGSHDLYEERNVLVHDIREKRHLHRISGAPLVEFDFLPNVAVFRRECLEDYTWDKEFPGYQHFDFYVGHKRQTDWSFGVCPQVIFDHYPGGDTDYLSYRNDTARLWEGKQMFLDKWDYRQVVLGETTWLQTRTHPPTKKSILTEFAKNVIRGLPIQLQALSVNVRDRIRVWRGRRPV